ncbi:MAG: rhodanese-like domain-containing protein [Melioribacteraceae bacterium]|nr:rhodanese-like domain-containing protein [Melioribacteraceae bacterium]
MNAFFSNLFGGNNGVANLDAKTFNEQMNSDPEAVLLDVRTQAEHYDAKIPNSKLIDLMNPHFMDEIEKLDKSKSYYLYCRSGNRSYHAAREMSRIGFTKVYNLAPGIIGWEGKIER